MRKSIFIALLATALYGAGCSEKSISGYSDEPAIYFHNAIGGQRDSIVHSFFFTESQTDTVWVRVNVMGAQTSADRPVSLIQTNAGEPDAAVAGKHYVAFDDPDIRAKMVIPANEPYGLVPIVFLRDESLETEKVRLALTVGDNEYFRPGIDEWRDFVITTTAMVEKPQMWDTNWFIYFGSTWGPVKFNYIIGLTGYTTWDRYPEDYYQLVFWQGLVLQKFEEYNRENPNDPMMEADGELVSFDIM